MERPAAGLYKFGGVVDSVLDGGSWFVAGEVHVFDVHIYILVPEFTRPGKVYRPQ